MVTGDAGLAICICSQEDKVYTVTHACPAAAISVHKGHLSHTGGHLHGDKLLDQ